VVLISKNMTGLAVERKRKEGVNQCTHQNSIFSRCFLDFTRIPLDNSDARKQRLFGLNILKKGWF
jgi:hypothetical protein